MLDYLFTCVAISLSALAAVWGLKQAPARVGFYLLMLALMSWFVPWQWLPDTALPEVSADAWLILASVDLQTPLLAQAATVAASSSEQIRWFQLLTFGHLAAALFSTGLVLFAWRLFNYLLLVNRLERSAMQKNQRDVDGVKYPIKVTQLFTPAIATGIFKPTIWVDSQLLQRDELPSVLLHEAMHIKQGDLVWIWLICLSESLFWWNPLSRLLASKARQKLELSCDEQCYAKLKQQYQLDLASLLLRPLAESSAQPQHCAQVLNMVNSKDFNVQRVKMLNKEKVMKMKHLAIVIAALSVSAVAATAIAASESVVKPDKIAVDQPSFSAAFTDQQSSLLKAALNAKSTQSAELTQVVANINAWQKNRMPLIGREEAMLKLQAFSLLAHVQHRLGLYQDVISDFAAWYPEGSKVPFFLRNITAMSYLQLKQPDLALNELAILQSEIGDDIRPGSLQLLAKVYIQKGDYAPALAALNHPVVQDHTTTNMLKYYIYTQQNDEVQLAKIKEQLPQAIANKPAELPDIGVPGSPLLIKL